MSAHGFTWIKFYMEFADRLLPYKGKRDELIAVLDSVFERFGMEIPRFPGTEKPADLDPFTALALLNCPQWGIPFTGYYSALKEEFGIGAGLPADNFGAHWLSNFSATLLPHVHECGKAAYDDLWELFDAALAYDSQPNDTNAARFAHAFDKAEREQQAWHNLTIGLYWCRPQRYLCLDYHIGKLMLAVSWCPPKTAIRVASPHDKLTGAEYLQLCSLALGAFASGESACASIPEFNFEMMSAIAHTGNGGRLGKVPDARPAAKDIPRWTRAKAHFANEFKCAPLTVCIVVICIVLFIPSLPGFDLGALMGVTGLAYAEPGVQFKFAPWMLVTSMFAHANALHLLCNMIALWIIGRETEASYGSPLFALWFFACGIVGNIAFALLGEGVGVGASGAIFGLMGDRIVRLFVARRIPMANAEYRQTVILLGVNLSISLFPMIAWQAHVGGMLAGAMLSLARLIVGWRMLSRNAGRRRDLALYSPYALDMGLTITFVVAHAPNSLAKFISGMGMNRLDLRLPYNTGLEPARRRMRKAAGIALTLLALGASLAAMFTWYGDAHILSPRALGQSTAEAGQTAGDAQWVGNEVCGYLHVPNVFEQDGDSSEDYSFYTNAVPFDNLEENEWTIGFFTTPYTPEEVARNYLEADFEDTDVKVEYVAVGDQAAPMVTLQDDERCTVTLYTRLGDGAAAIECEGPVESIDVAEGILATYSRSL